MDVVHKKILRAITLELRHILEGSWSARGEWLPGDLEQRLRSLGVREDGTVVAVDELPHLTPHDLAARRVVDAWLILRAQSGASGAAAVAELVRETAWSWATRLLALRCMEARGIIDDEVVVTKPAYAGRSMLHQRLVRKDPALEATEDGGLFATLDQAFKGLHSRLPRAFDPQAPGIALRPSVAALTQCIGLLSGTQRPRGQEAATDAVFQAPDALGWAYQYWNAEEKQRVFDRVAGKGADRKRHKIEGADIVPATQLYTEPYMVQFLVQNALGGLWASMHSRTRLIEGWSYFVRDAERPEFAPRPVRSLTFLDPACGSGHFLLEAFDLLFAMYREEDPTRDAAAVAADVLTHNLFGLDIDERAVHIAEVALWMRAAERAQEHGGTPPQVRANLVATNVHLPREGRHLDRFLEQHPDDEPLRPALKVVFDGLAHADELGALLLLDEPVDEALRAIEAEERARGIEISREAQARLFGPEDRSRLPAALSTWAAWRADVLGRLRQHFAQEARSADPVAAHFGRSLVRALDLFDLLSRRYDVVAANPPYMGSKNMGPVLRRHLEENFPTGKRDLYAAFILRCVSLSAPMGRVAMVTQQSWMFLSSFGELRSGRPGSGGLLATTHVEVLAQLGRYAFSEIGNAVVAPVLFVCHKDERAIDGSMWACRLKTPRPSDEQARLLLEACRGALQEIAFLVEQPKLAALPGSQLCFWVPPRLLSLFAATTVSGRGEVRQGLATAEDARFLRCVWEVDSSGARWRPFFKGGGYRKWDGLETLAIDWEHNAARLKAFPRSVIRNESTYFQPGWTYSRMAAGQMGVRRMASPGVFGDTGPAIFLSDDEFVVALGSRVGTYMLRAVSPSLKFEVDSVSNTPLPASKPRVDADALVSAKALLTATDITERAFSGVADLSTLLARWANLHTLEGEAERAVMDAYGLDSHAVAAIVADTGTPAGWLPDEVTPNVREHMRLLFEAGPDGRVEDAEVPDAEVEDETDDEAVAADLGTGRPIHTETFLEALSVKAGVSPRAAWAILQEGLAAGWRCASEDHRIAADRVSVLVLRLLGHRWPLEVERGDPVPEWVDQDGIVPLTSIPRETPLVERLRDRLYAEDLDEVALATALDVPVEQWLHTRFAVHHKQQFENRPVAWQLQSSTFTARKPPAFAALVYAQRVSAEMLARLRSHYVGPLVERRRQEVRTLSSAAQRSPAQEDQLHDLRVTVEELEKFLEALTAVERRGFWSDGLRAVAVQEVLQSLVWRVLDRWRQELADGPLAGWLKECRTVDESVAYALEGGVGVLPTLCGRCADLVDAPSWEATPPSPDALRAAVIAAIDNGVDVVRASLRKALRDSAQRWMKDERDKAKAKKVRAPKFTEEKQSIAWLEDQIKAWAPESSGLASFLDDLPLFDAWCAEPGRAAPERLEDFVEQEAAWRPDVNDGVRVNVAPLQKAGLLAADPLVERDVEPAIADRARWRADERRWVREGKLPRPGWWPA